MHDELTQLRAFRCLDGTWLVQSRLTTVESLGRNPGVYLLDLLLLQHLWEEIMGFTWRYQNVVRKF
jgi:hypothetical protein